MTERKFSIERQTKETQIKLSLNLDVAGRGSIKTGSGFLDHMLDLFQVHSGTTLEVECNGDTWIDMHHSAEDIAICLGQALYSAIGDKKGIERYGFYIVPMDEALARVCLDFSGRMAFVWECPDLRMEHVGNIHTELFEHFFHTVAENCKMNLHVDLIRGRNTHHIIEGIFKAFARSVAMAISPSRKISGLPSSKGLL